MTSVTLSLPVEQALAYAESISAGQPKLAAEVYRAIIAAMPGTGAPFNLLGVALYRCGDIVGAIDAMRRATEAAPTDALSHCNLCELYRLSGNSEAALAAGKMAVRINPKLPQALNNLAIVQSERGELEEAVALYRRAVDLAPSYAEAFSNLGNALRAQKLYDEALPAYERALELRPEFVDGLNNLGTTLRDIGRTEDAEAVYRRAVAIEPDNPKVLTNLALALKEREQFEEAAELLSRAVSLDPTSSKSWTYLALVKLDRKETVEAEVAAARALELDPDDAGALNAMGLVRFDQESDEAAELFLKATSRDPSLADAHNNLGNVLREKGKLEEAAKAFSLAITLDPRETSYYLNLSDAKRFGVDDPDLEAMLRLVRDPNRTDQARTTLHFAIAKAFDDLGRYDDAFSHLAEGSQLKRKIIAYDEGVVLGVFDRIKTVFDRRLLSAAQSGFRSPLPVFVVGMPRSGTTLIEQILASHPDVYAAGELSDFDALVRQLPGPVGDARFQYPDDAAFLTERQIESLGRNYVERQWARAQRAKRATDKMPANFLFLGLIHMAMPGARIIHVMRDPRDTCLSCFSKLFSMEQAFTYDLGELGRYYRAYAGLMDHWRATLPTGVMLEVRYEELIADLEHGVHQMLAHLKLPYDAACLRFHETDRTVRTASASQVRRPLSTDSVGRWRRYERHLGPLLRGLGDVALSSG